MTPFGNTEGDQQRKTNQVVILEQAYYSKGSDIPNSNAQDAMQYEEAKKGILPSVSFEFATKPMNRK